MIFNEIDCATLGGFLLVWKQVPFLSPIRDWFHRLRLTPDLRPGLYSFAASRLEGEYPAVRGGSQKEVKRPTLSPKTREGWGTRFKLRVAGME